MAASRMQKQASMRARAKVRVDVTGWESLAFVTVPQAAVILNCGKTKCWDLVYAGVIPSVRWVGQRRVPVAGLKSYIARVCEEAGLDAA